MRQVCLLFGDLDTFPICSTVNPFEMLEFGWSIVGVFIAPYKYVWQSSIHKQHKIIASNMFIDVLPKCVCLFKYNF